MAPRDIEEDENSSAPPPGRFWALLVGINEYVEPSFPPLKYCVRDVLALETTLEDLGYTVVGLHDDAEQERLLPTAINIRAELTRVCKVAGPEDLILVHFACHGLRVEELPYLVTRETRMDILTDSALPLSIVEKILRGSNARRKVITLDACHVGMDAGREIPGSDFNRHVHEMAAGFAVIAGSTSQQVAQEWKEKQHGVFTYHLLDGLQGRADRSGKGFVTVDDLKNHVLDGLRRWNVEHGGILQEPTARTEGMGDMIVATYRPKTPVASPAVGARPFLVPSITDPFGFRNTRGIKKVREGFAQQHDEPLHIQCIYGLRGAGSTRTAIQYAHQYRDEYAACFFSGADCEASLRSSFFEIARTLGLSQKDPRSVDEAVRLVQEWMRQNHGFLLILAHAGSPELVRPFVPFDADGHVLLTAERDFRELPAVPIRLDVPTQKEALDYLRRRTGYKLQGGEEQAAIELIEDLGRLPMALEQAAAYVVAHQMPFSLHLNALRTRSETWAHYRAAKLWDLCMEQVEKESPGGMDLLRLSAFLHGDCIYLDLFQKEGVLRGEVMQEMGPVLAGLTQIEELYDALRSLTRYSLIYLDPEAGIYSINRLLQQAVQRRLGEEGRREWMQRAIHAVERLLRRLQYEDWPQQRHLGPQVSIAASLIMYQGIATRPAGRLLNWSGFYLHEQGRYDDAEKHYQSARKICEAAFGPDSVQLSFSLNGLGRIRFRQGHYPQAEEHFSRSLRIRQQVLGKGHPQVASSLNNLALLHFRMNATDPNIEASYREVLRIRESALGPDHPHVAKTLNNLALFCSAQLRFNDALSYHERALSISEKSMGADHPDVSQILCGMAGVHLRCGNLPLAERMLLRAKRICDEVLGADHPDSSFSRVGLGWLCAAQGRSAEAERHFLEARDIRERRLGKNHPDLARCLYALGRLYQSDRRPDEAEALYGRALQIWAETLAPDHPDVMECRRRLTTPSSRSPVTPAHLLPLDEGFGLSGP